MNVETCSHEDQIVQAVLSGRWPDRCDPELAVHASSCEVCGEVASIATLLRTDHEDARRHVQVPAAGQVWWRAAIRARLETAQASTQPMTWLHGVTAAIMVGLMLTLVGVLWPSIGATVEWAKTAAVSISPRTDVTDVVLGALRQSFIIAAVAGVCLILAPLALYFVLSDD